MGQQTDFKIYVHNYYSQAKKIEIKRKNKAFHKKTRVV